MDTSRSNEHRESWVAGAFIFSGRRDPQWELTPEEGDELAQALARLLPAPGQVVRAPPLGYRGVWLREPGGREWHLYGGMAAHGDTGRLDAGRELERRVLATAPAGVLPPGLAG